MDRHENLAIAPVFRGGRVIESLESRAVLAANDVLVGLADNRWRLDAELAAIGGLTGFEPGPSVNSGDNGASNALAPPLSDGVTGVKTGCSSLAIPYGPRGFVPPRTCWAW